MVKQYRIKLRVLFSLNIRTLYYVNVRLQRINFSFIIQGGW